MATALGRKCQRCKIKAAEVVVPSNKKPVRPVYTRSDCSIDYPNVFYDGPPIFHFRGENGQWYFVFIHHDHLVPYFYPIPDMQIAGDMGGEIMWEQASPRGRREWEEPVCERIVPYKLVTRSGKRGIKTVPDRFKQDKTDV